jgi:hypothetical protein
MEHVRRIAGHALITAADALNATQDAASEATAAIRRRSMKKRDDIEKWRKHPYLPLYHNHETLFWDNSGSVQPNPDDLFQYLWGQIPPPSREELTSFIEIDLGTVDGTKVNLKNVIRLDRTALADPTEKQRIIDAMRETHENVATRQVQIQNNAAQLEVDLAARFEVFGLTQLLDHALYDSAMECVRTVFAPPLPDPLDPATLPMIPGYVQGHERVILLLLWREQKHGGTSSEEDDIVLLEHRVPGAIDSSTNVILFNFRLTLFALQHLLPAPERDLEEAWWFFGQTIFVNPPERMEDVIFPAFDNIHTALREVQMNMDQAVTLAFQIRAQYQRMQAAKDQLAQSLGSYLDDDRIPEYFTRSIAPIAFRGATKQRRPSRRGGAGTRKRSNSRRSPRGNARSQRSHSRRSHSRRSRGRRASRTRLR